MLHVLASWWLLHSKKVRWIISLSHVSQERRREPEADQVTIPWTLIQMELQAPETSQEAYLLDMQARISLLSVKLRISMKIVLFYTSEANSSEVDIIL